MTELQKAGQAMPATGGEKVNSFWSRLSDKERQAAINVLWGGLVGGSLGGGFGAATDTGALSTGVAGTLLGALAGGAGTLGAGYLSGEAKLPGAEEKKKSIFMSTVDPVVRAGIAHAPTVIGAGIGTVPAWLGPTPGRLRRQLAALAKDSDITVRADRRSFQHALRSSPAARHFPDLTSGKGTENIRKALNKALTDPVIRKSLGKDFGAIQEMAQSGTVPLRSRLAGTRGYFGPEGLLRLLKDPALRGRLPSRWRFATPALGGFLGYVAERYLKGR